MEENGRGQRLRERGRGNEREGKKKRTKEEG